MTFCDDCADVKKCCSKCGVTLERNDRMSQNEGPERQKAIERILPHLSERERRSVLRKMEKGEDVLEGLLDREENSLVGQESDADDLEERNSSGKSDSDDE